MELGKGTEETAHVKYSGYLLNHHVPRSFVISWKKDLERGTTRGINKAEFPLSTVHHDREEPKIASSASFPPTKALFFFLFLCLMKSVVLTIKSPYSCSAVLESTLSWALFEKVS